MTNMSTRRSVGKNVLFGVGFEHIDKCLLVFVGELLREVDIKLDVEVTFRQKAQTSQ